ncbi:GspE/PulE family protein [Ammoniphilus sp. YIM 78166]|uniref:GspE/PulE family protein n=1 Tax=Ammoniphilus sp. YIM 78166 TaxID=1644106 RepID=UPI00106F76C6|nr:GspE/PulE family protein [Ammoniphilus sp. YIM 78166]
MIQRKRLGDLLVESGLITPQQLQQALEEQKDSGLKLGDLLIARGYITEQQKIELLEFQLGIPHVQLHRQKIDDKAVRLIPMNLAKKHQALPLRIESGKLIVAMSDPLDYYAIDDLRMSTDMLIEVVIATKEELNRAISRSYQVQQSVHDMLEDMDTDTEDEEIADESSPVVNLLNQTISQAVSLGASDVHFEPQEAIIKVRFRIDGVLRTENEFPINMLGVITGRLKILGGLNITEKRVPQDGRFEFDTGLKRIDIRISSLPTIHGEKLVLRLLDPANANREIDNIGFSEQNLSLFKKMIAAPYGLILITGPTGSGKTTTLYSALRYLNRDDVNIVTVEDPVEYQLNGVNQVQVNPSAGLSYSTGLRSILRQDPDIVMVGEVRDNETAEMVIRSSMTGHLVLSTLHTNDAVSTFNRLMDMGIEPFLVSSSLRGIVAQRLVRTICTSCKVEVEIPSPHREIFEANQMKLEKYYIGKGCDRCNQTGYRGRMAIHEVLIADGEMKKLIVQVKPDTDYKELALKQGFRPIFLDGLYKVATGLTTISELQRVCME